MKKELTCIVCPLGCRLCAEVSDKKVVSVTGNTCPRGAAYAETELISPMRTITTTMRCTNGALVSVKTAKPIPKEHIRDAMKTMNAHKIVLPISVGTVIMKDVFGSDVVATKNMR